METDNAATDNTDITLLLNELRSVRAEMAQLSSRMLDMENARHTDLRVVTTRLTDIDASIRGLSLTTIVGDYRIPILGLISTCFSVLFLVAFTVTHSK